MTAAELETWPYDGDEGDGIVDGEVIEETVESLPLLPVLREPADVAIPHVPVRVRLAGVRDHLADQLTGPQTSAAFRRGTWALGHFVVIDLPAATGVGLGRWVRTWWRWVRLSEDRADARLKGTWIEKSKGIREQTRRNVLGSLVTALVVSLAGLTFYWLAPPEYVATVCAVLLLALFSSGYRWSQPQETVIATASQMGWAGSIESIRQALIDAGLMRPDQTISPVVHPHEVGAGYLMVVDLPPGLTADRVKTKRSEFASALRVNSSFMNIEQAGPDSRMRLWISVGDPFAGGPQRFPLLDADRWNAWLPAPFGVTPSGQEVPLRLLYSNYLGGGKPRQGKTFTSRIVVAPYVLDPRPRIFCANGKGDGAWNAIGQVAVTYTNGRSNDAAWQVNAMLDQVIAEMDDRFSRMSGSRIVEEDGLEPWALIIDEVHLYTANSELTDERIRGKKDAPLGEVIAHKLTDIVKIGPAAGIILVLLTQKPGDTSIPADLRDQMGTRFANKVMTYQTSNQILGNLSPLGYDASRISAQHKGVGILVPDMDESVTGDLELDDYPTVRPYFCDDQDWNALCARGRELRLEAGTLEGHAAGETAAPEDEGIEEADVVASEIPEVLESIFDFVHGRDDKDRVAARDLRERFDPEATEQAFGRQLRRWGCPSGRDGGRGPSGPRVRDIHAAVERMRAGGPIEVER
jgi:S-DNA-T family DNA segregation ATPase FtsK/SpoIIIE